MAYPRVLAAASVAALVLAGCAGLGPPPQPPPGAAAPLPAQRPPTPPAREYVIRTPFNEADFAPYAGPGNANIAGEAYLTLPDGRIVTAAGSEVVLVPDTPYTRELLEPARSGQYAGVANFDPRYARYRRATRADEHGFFRFTNVPPGAYILQASVPLPAPGTHGPGTGRVFLHEPVTVEPESAANVVLTR